MRLKRSQPLRKHPRGVQTVELGTIETTAEFENQREDAASMEELERTSKDYWGRGYQETDGAIPIDPPDVDPFRLHYPEKPKGPPKHNM